MPTNATAGVTYINGVTGTNGNTQEYIGSTALPLGSKKYGGTAYSFLAASGNNVRAEAINVVAGNVLPPKIIGTLNDRAPNVPSGYNRYGVATFGDGKLNTNTTWAVDNSRLANTTIIYANGGSGVHKPYGSQVS